MKNPPRTSSFKKSVKKPFKKRPIHTSGAKKPVAKKVYKKPNPPRTQKASYATKAPTNSWGGVASWYDEHLKMEGTYHKEIVLPNLMRLVSPRRGDAIVDLACGTGFFSEAFAKDGAMMTGIDVSEELIAIARKNAPQVSFHAASAEQFDIVPSNTKDKVVIVLAIQNIEHVSRVFSEAARVLRPGGTFHIVMNHPAFRIPKRSFWGYDEKRKIQYRRLDGYLSEASVAIDMHPGIEGSPRTISYHRPLQYYFKALQKAGFSVERLEEWTSHKESDSGPRKKAENDARKEFPLFLYLGAKKSD